MALLQDLPLIKAVAKIDLYLLEWIDKTIYGAINMYVSWISSEIYHLWLAEKNFHYCIFLVLEKYRFQVYISPRAMKKGKSWVIVYYDNLNAYSKYTLVATIEITQCCVHLFSNGFRRTVLLVTTCSYVVYFFHAIHGIWTNFFNDDSIIYDQINEALNLVV